MQYLTIALTKGRLAGQTMELFEKAGFFCEELKDKKSRKLIFTNEEQKLRFFLSKGPDVPTYVEYGAADIGIVGSDIILEEQRRCHEVLASIRPSISSSSTDPWNWVPSWNLQMSSLISSRPAPH